MIDLYGVNGLYVIFAIPVSAGRVMEHTPRVAQIEAENGYTAVMKWLKSRPHLKIGKYTKKRWAEVFTLEGPRLITDYGLGKFVEPIDIPIDM